MENLEKIPKLSFDRICVVHNLNLSYSLALFRASCKISYSTYLRHLRSFYHLRYYLSWQIPPRSLGKAAVVINPISEFEASFTILSYVPLDLNKKLN